MSNYIPFSIKTFLSFVCKIVQVHSVIDFGDSNRNPLVYEVAITIMYMMTRCSSMSPSLAGGHVIAGYIRHRQLSALERRLVRICVASR